MGYAGAFQRRVMPNLANGKVFIEKVDYLLFCEMVHP
jgi:hypothetical protein